MTPIDALAILLLITAAAAVGQRISRRRHVQKLRALAARWEMHFSPTDRFRLGPRIVQQMPVPGAAAVHVIDLLYRLEAQNHRYIFCAEYSTGVLRNRAGARRVGTLTEPRDSSNACGANVIFAPPSLSIIEQYEHLHQGLGSGC